MKYEQKTVTLKNGKEVTLKTPTETDAEEVLRYLAICAAETEFVLRYEEECNPRSNTKGSSCAQ